MKEETNLEQIKEMARLFLMFEPKETPFSPMIVKHPFIDYGMIICTEKGIAAPKNILTNESGFRIWR